jgi:surface antigen-like variable number repeat protein
VRKRIVSTALFSIILVTVHHAQEAPTPDEGNPTERELDTQVTANRVHVQNVRFEGVTKLSSLERHAIAAEVMHKPFKTGSNAASEAEDLTRVAYLNAGYFKVQMEAWAHGVAAADDQWVEVLVRSLSEGQPYRLKTVAWFNNTAFTKRELRALMPIQDGDVASREKISRGLEALRFAYGEKGYLNFTYIPDTILHDETNTIELSINLDEGGQFTLADVIVSGLPADQIDSIMAVAAGWKGKPFTLSFVDRVFDQFRSTFPKCANPVQNSTSSLDEKTHTATLELNFDDCYSGWLNSEGKVPVANCCPK